MSMAEVLVALFIMALGTIAILTMFPLGMFQMGQALKDDRTAQAAAQADAYMRSYWRTRVVENPNADNPLAPVGTAVTPGFEPFVGAFDNPDSKPDPSLGAPSPTRGQPPIPKRQGLSYPVFVDPMGYLASWQDPGNFKFWVGDQTIPRRSVSAMNGQPQQYAQRVCSLMDGFGYNQDGLPNPTGSVIERELRYNWLWVLQRPDNSNRNTVNMTVVVFDRRAFLFGPPDAERAFPPVVVPPASPTAPAPGMPGSTTICFTTGTPLRVMKGGWILDATINPLLGVRNANFYRVVSVTDDGTLASVELQTPIKSDAIPAADQRTIIVPLGVSEVFERPALTGSDF
jgi:hypothetical protein